MTVSRNSSRDWQNSSRASPPGRCAAGGHRAHPQRPAPAPALRRARLGRRDRQARQGPGRAPGREGAGSHATCPARTWRAWPGCARVRSSRRSSTRPATGTCSWTCWALSHRSRALPPHPRTARGGPRLAARLAVPYDVTLHDYLAICPQHHLATASGRYCGEPDERHCDLSLAGRPPAWPLDIRSWRGRFGQLLRARTGSSRLSSTWRAASCATIPRLRSGSGGTRRTPSPCRRHRHASCCPAASWRSRASAFWRPPCATRSSGPCRCTSVCSATSAARCRNGRMRRSRRPATIPTASSTA